MRHKGLLCLVLLAFAGATQAASSTYQVDPAQTHASFETRFLAIIPVRGIFKQTTGQLDYDPETRQGSLRAYIHLASLQTATNDDGGTDRLLKGPEFFDVEKFPLIEFISSKFHWEEDKLTAIEGTLTLRGVSKPATLGIQKSRCIPAGATPDAKARCEATAELRVKRSEFGVNGWSTTVSDNVYINVEFVAVAEPKGTEGKASESKPPASAEAAPPAVPASPSPSAPPAR